MAKQTTEYFSDKFGTKVNIGTLEIELFKTIVLNDVFIEDQHHDTLFYSSKFKIDLKELNIGKQKIYFKNIVLIKTQASLIKHITDKDFNYQFIINSFGSKHTNTKESSPWDIRVDNIQLLNCKFVYKNEHDTLITTGINYFDLQTKTINASITDVKMDHDTIFAGINKLFAIEKSGFILSNLSSSRVKLNSKELQAENLKIKTPYSSIETDLTFKYQQYEDYTDFIDKVRMSAQFSRSKLDMSDVSYFAPDIKGMKQTLIITGKINGKINDLRGKDMLISFGNSTAFHGDISMTGLPNMDETVTHLTIKNLITDYNDLQLIPLPPFTENKKLKVSPEIKRLGKIRFKGTFTGLYNDFYAYGDLNCNLGKVSSDLSVQHDIESKKDFYKGKLKSVAFDFGNFFSIPALGKVSMNVDVDGSGLSLENITAKLNGTINSLELNKYEYKNIDVKGDASKQVFNGQLTVKDENIDFDFSGKVDFIDKLPHLDFTMNLNKANLGALRFIDTLKTTNLSTAIALNVTGNNIDNLIGQIHIKNTKYRVNDNEYLLKDFDLNSIENNGIKTLSVNSDFLDATINGSFKILELPVSVQQLFSKYLPSFFDKKIITQKISPQNFEFNFLFKNSKDITGLFAPFLSIAPQSSIHGKLNSKENDFKITAISPKISFYGYNFNEWSVNSSSNGHLDFDMKAQRLFISDSLWLNQFDLLTKTHSDSIDLSIAWNNQSKRLNKGNIKAFLSVKGFRSFDFKIQPSEFFINDTAWSISNTNKMAVDSNYISVEDLKFYHGNQSISINGVVSENKDDKLIFGFHDFDLTHLNGLLERTGLALKGYINGTSSITNLYHNVVFSSNTEFKSFYINNNDFGDGTINSLWDKNKQALYMHGSFTLGIVPNVLFSGYYYPAKKEDNLDVDLNFQAVNLQLFEPFVKEYCSDLKGFLAGKIAVKGSTENPVLSGILNVNAKKITVDYLNTTYNFSHDIIITNNSFQVEKLSLYDIYHNVANVTGKVYHTNFKNFQLDFDINAKKFMCLNTTEINNSSYYGKAFVTGIAKVSGYINNNILIKANVKTEKVTTDDKFDIISAGQMTKFYIPVSGTGEMGESDFITFVKKDQPLKTKDDYKIKTSGITLDFDLDVTPDAEVQLIFDQKVGDILKATGNGNLKLNINTTGEFKMFGDYVIEGGDYLFTLQNIMNKRFYLEKGGVIKWSGNPYDADLDLSAVYKTRAALIPFFAEGSPSTGGGSTSNPDQYKKRVPIDLKLLMTGDLKLPEINFNVEIPTVDASTKQTVLSYINTDAEKNRQVFSLLILNSFVRPYQLAGDVTSGNNSALNAVGSNSTEMLSNQLSNMLSKISKDVDVGVNYRPGDEISKKELELVLSTQLFNDKLTVDGNVGNNTSQNPNNANNIVGEVNVEYKLTDDGKLKMKAFNRANDNTQLNLSNGAYTQGVGIFYREEFDTVDELIRRYMKIFHHKREENEVDNKEKNK